MSKYKYNTIVIDPPWPGPGESTAFNGHTRFIPYATMTGIQIAAMPIREITSPRAQLFIWAGSRGLGDAYLLAQSWGFRYRSLFIWHKPLGLGLHVRHQCEFLLWAARKGAPTKRIGTRCPLQIHHWPRRAHSEKPKEAYELIRSLSDAPRLDLFARQQHRGFTSWGNELATPDPERATA